MMKTYEALIFDLGKVVFDLSFDNVFKYWASASGQQAEIIKGKFEFDKFFDEFERGEVSNQAFRTKISRRLDFELTNQLFDEGWCSLYLHPYEGINELLSSLKTRYRLVTLTNTNSIHERVWKIKYHESLVYFEKIFSSQELKARKPETRAYQIVLDYLGIEPSCTIFLDDNRANVEGAAQLGIQTILVESPSQMQADLRNLLHLG